MILYKYRSLGNLEQVLDIILNQRLYCTTYPELNDPFEGIFETSFQNSEVRLRGAVAMGRSPSYVRGLAESLKVYKKVEELNNSTKNHIRICSLSSDLNDVRLWSYYADGHKGIVFEIDFSGMEKIYKVIYSEKLPWSSTGILGRLSPHEILSHKTNHWEFESEYRIIYESTYLEEKKYFGINGRIKAIYLGTRTSENHRNLLKNIVQGKIPIYTTNINHKKVIVEPDKLIEEK
jgi:hypothetical protein